MVGFYHKRRILSLRLRPVAGLQAALPRGGGTCPASRVIGRDERGIGHFHE
jgi:hypothetical protein